jgi:thiol-disulfide isomerase/thioredoxin
MQARPVSRRWRFRTSWALTGLAALAAVAFGIYLSLSLSQPSAALPEGLPFAAVSPQPVPQLEFLDGESHARSLAEFRGKLVVLNIWATWCKPCREEMPALDRLQAALGDADVQVVALSIDREGVPIVRKYYDEVGIKALPLYVDPSGQAGST